MLVELMKIKSYVHGIKLYQGHVLECDFSKIFHERTYVPEGMFLCPVGREEGAEAK